MLAVRDTPTRERRSLDGLWRFAVDADGVGGDQRWFEGLPAEAREMPVPASYNDIYPEGEIHDHVGDAWYETTIRVPAGWAGERIVLRFEAATHRAVVWVNGEQVAQHEGGYLPFEAEITELVRPGDELLISVAVNNVLNWQSIPPGIVEETPAGPRQSYFHDFFNYAGLHRSVWVYRTPASYISDVTVVTDLRGSTGGIRYEVEAQGADGLELQVAIRDVDGTEVARASGWRGELQIDDVHPWRPGEGYLYDLGVELVEDGDTPVDVYSLPVGIRTVEVDGTRFLINGEPFYFRGFGKHEDSAVRGKAHDDPLMVHDFALMDWIGANSFRTSHYPYAEEVLDYADRHGIVLIDECPAVGLNATLASILGGTSFTTFSPETINEETREVHAQTIREMVARDKNHPGVVMWSIANEPESWTPESRAYFEPLAVETRSLDSSRPVAFANLFLATPDRDVISDLFDVLMLNRYQGWYVYPGDLTAAEEALESELQAWTAKYDKPIIFSEYGADAVAGLHALGQSLWTEEYQAALLTTFHRVFDRFDAVVGEHVWNFADFATAVGTNRVDGNKKGVFTRERRPKAAAHLLRERWRRASTS
jgi:beta-glucuronidase